jgi:hypothetical protein
MFDINEFDRWKRNTYLKYWIRKSREYGFDYYCKGLIALIYFMLFLCGLAVVLF